MTKVSRVLAKRLGMRMSVRRRMEGAKKRKNKRGVTPEVIVSRTVIELDCAEAQDFFFQGNSYCSIELPPYFHFSVMLKRIQTVLRNRVLTDGDFGKFKKMETANHLIYTNKGDRYSWRKLQIINPILYIKLVEEITENSNWSEIQNRFRDFGSNARIQCMSIPVLPNQGETRLGAQISSWLDKFEGESIKLGMKYEYMYKTDISNCYSSVYTHSVAWAIHTKTVAKAIRGKNLFGNRIDEYLQAMTNGQTNGIPEGSTLMDFIAEVVLGYTDELLAQELAKANLPTFDYQILRYRDDYRIFVHQELIGEEILKLLSKNLMDFGMRLNQNKTGKSHHIILDSIKPTKLTSYDRHRRRIRSNLQLRNELLSILHAGQNSIDPGHIRTRLEDLVKLLEKRRGLTTGHEMEILSILVNIAFEKPVTFPIIAKLISALLMQLPYAKQEIFDDILRKLRLLPNSGLLEIWLQRIAKPHGIYLVYNEPLCQLLNAGTVTKLFDDSWQANSSFADLSLDLNFVDKGALNNLTWEVAMEEVAIFPDY
jgi:RNA-directed DNA polymerase